MWSDSLPKAALASQALAFPTWKPHPLDCAEIRTRIRALIEYERDLHNHAELGDLVVVHHGLELLGPDRADVADRAGCTLHRLADRVLIALRGLARQFD